MALPLQQKAGQPQLRPGDTLVVIRMSIEPPCDNGNRVSTANVVPDDFIARSSDELTLRKSERVELIELDEGFGDGWYLGRHLARGSTGLFPGGKLDTGQKPKNTDRIVYTTRAPPVPSKPAQPQPLHRSSYSPPTSTYSNTPLSPIPPSPATYQQTDSPTSSGPRAVSQYSPAFAYDSPRTSLPPAYSSYAPGVQRSIGQTLGDNHGGEDSPVMNETLSVIDEHITDLSTPRQSLVPPKTIPEDSESDYSSRLDQHSYIAGPETDDEENGRVTEAEVRKWDHKKAAEHLRSIGVDSKHCDIFEEQEIPGEVLLDMDQGFIYMKEYDFGVMGRRLKTWHKIRDFQNEVKRRKSSRQATMSSIDGTSSLDDISRTQSKPLSSAALLPRIPSLAEKPGLNIRQSHHSVVSHEDANMGHPALQSTGSFPRLSMGGQTPPSPWRASMISDTSSRPSAAMVRELSHSRRHSSIDFGKQPDLKLSASALGPPNASHHKQPSLDRDWTLSASTLGTPASPAGVGASRELSAKGPSASPPMNSTLEAEVDRGYFSGNDIDNRKQRNTLRKRDSGSGSAMHSRQASANNMAMKKHSRLASVDSIRDIGPQAFSSASKAYYGKDSKGRLRSSSARESISKSTGSTASPTVTNLEQGGPTHPRVVSAGPQPKSSLPNKARKFMGLRATSEAVTNADKSIASQSDQPQDSSRTSPVASPTGSNTPSGTSRSMEYEASEAPSKLSDVQGLHLPKAQARNRPKAKQETSAYQRGLLKLTPAEAREHCDYHGWMKKKSSSLITTWKPRLFILRGRRLSYYYSESDTEERGIIDISGHKVLVANSDAMITLHAQITGATSAASPNSLATSSNEPSPNLTRSPEPGSGSLFYFKLVPPKSGSSRAVQFTKPTVHYFQVDTIVEGRKWMGEMMKATIEHDLSSYETTNKQKTISLAKARARRERPPALQEEQDGPEPKSTDEVQENVRESGLNIQGLDFSDSPVSLDLMGEKARDSIQAQQASGTNTTTTNSGSIPQHTS